MTATRRLAAILAADVAGYSRLMGADEEGTLERLKALRHELLDPKIAEHKGRILGSSPRTKTTGDGLLVEFASVVDAVRCAVAVQQAMPERNAGVAADNRIELRIGINLGDVIVEGDDLYGDGVNIAARIEALADAGGVLVSNTVHDHVRDRLPFAFEDLGEQQVKNITRRVRVYRVRTTLTHPAAEAPGSPSPAMRERVPSASGGRRVRAAPGVIEPALQAAEAARSAYRPTNDLTAYDLYLRACAVAFSLAPEALRLLDQAIGRDPHYGPALALAAHFHAQRCIAGWSQDPEADCRDGADPARRALQVAGDDPGTIVDAAFALAFFGDDIGAMMALVDRALALNPSFARGWSCSGLLSLFAGQPERAIEHAEAALRLSPRARVGTTLGIIGAAHLFGRRFGLRFFS